MTHIGPLNGLLIACILTPEVGKAQVERWRAFGSDYVLSTERTDTRLTIHYVKVEDSIQRLRELVAAESTRCAFVDLSHRRCRAGATADRHRHPEQFAALGVG